MGFNSAKTLLIPAASSQVTIMAQKLRCAACHTSPVFLSAQDTAQKAVGLIEEASKNGANLVVFPETFIPAFPVWSSFLPPTHNHEFFRRMSQESVYADGDEMGSIRNAAKQNKIIVSIGFSEKVRYSSATLFNSNMIIGDDGEILVHHRKLMPTFFEKLTWAPGDGHGLRVADTNHGKIGMLICGENTNPLARYAMMSQGEQVHISTWPAVWPTRIPGQKSDGVDGVESHSEDDHQNQIDAPDKATPRQARNYDNVAANRTRAAAHCFEAKCFGILSAAYMDAASIQVIATTSGRPEAARSILEQSPRAATMFLDATGALLPGYIIDRQTGSKTTRDFLQHEEGILYADMDLEECIEGKQYHDVVGGYQRLDVFELKVDRSRREPIAFLDQH